MSMSMVERWTEVTNYSAETIATRVIIESGEVEKVASVRGGTAYIRSSI